MKNKCKNPKLFKKSFLNSSMQKINLHQKALIYLTLPFLQISIAYATCSDDTSSSFTATAGSTCIAPNSQYSGLSAVNIIGPNTNVDFTANDVEVVGDVVTSNYHPFTMSGGTTVTTKNLKVISNQSPNPRSILINETGSNTLNVNGTLTLITHQLGANNGGALEMYGSNNEVNVTKNLIIDTVNESKNANKFSNADGIRTGGSNVNVGGDLSIFSGGFGIRGSGKTFVNGESDIHSQKISIFLDQGGYLELSGNSTIKTTSENVWEKTQSLYLGKDAIVHAKNNLSIENDPNPQAETAEAAFIFGAAKMQVDGNLSITTTLGDGIDFGKKILASNEIIENDEYAIELANTLTPAVLDESLEAQLTINKITDSNIDGTLLDQYGGVAIINGIENTLVGKHLVQMNAGNATIKNIDATTKSKLSSINLIGSDSFSLNISDSILDSTLGDAAIISINRVQDSENSNVTLNNIKVRTQNAIISTSNDNNGPITLNINNSDLSSNINTYSNSFTDIKSGDITLNFTNSKVIGLTKNDATLNLNLDKSIWSLNKDSDDSSALFTNLSLNNNSEINLKNSGEFKLIGDVLSNNSLINLANTTLGNKLTIEGNYTGTNAILKINTELGDDNSSTDFLSITGDAKGSTNIKVKNVGGLGAITDQGIHIIQTGDSTENAFFVDDDNSLSAGIYTYSLIRKEEDNSVNWYLTSDYDRNGDGKPDGPIYTPDVGSYLANEMMGNILFTSRLEDREGASQYQTLGKENGNVWIRTYGSHNQFHSMSDQLKTKGDSFVTQIGTGLVTLGEEDQYNLGAMAGYAHYSGKTRSNLVDLSSKTKMNGYSVGLYGTWYAFPLEKRGAYIDSWVLWNKFKNTIDTADQHHYKYDSSGVTASIELGGDYLLNKNGKQNWWIQPQSQVIYQGVHMDDFYDAQGYKISHGSANVQARMGFKTYLEIPSTEGAFTNYRPYVALNFIHNTNPYAVDISGEEFTTQGSQNLGEVKLGIEGNLGKNSYVWANASYAAGSHSNQAYQGNIGWKYNF